MGPTGKRVLGYGVGALVAGGLVYFGFIHEGDPDPNTLLSSVDIQIRFASGMPERDKDGNVLQTRVEMLRDVRANLDRLEVMLPNWAPAQEYRAFLSFLDGDHLGAADQYRALRDMDDCSQDLWDGAVFNEVRMSQLGGDLERALRVITANRDRVQDDHLGSADLFRARVLSKLDRLEEAVRVAESVGRLGASHPLSALEAGQLLESWGRLEEAETAYVAASGAEPRGIYYRARLKVRGGDVDEGLRLLELAVAAATSVRNLVTRDQEDWKAVAGNVRFRDLVGPQGSVSAPGR